MSGPIHEALELLGIDRLVLSIQDRSFPFSEGEDLGRGSPTSRAAVRLLRWASSQGFTGVQLGPQGELPKDNPSPYDGTLFSRTALNLNPARLSERWPALFPSAVVAAWFERRPPGSDASAEHAFAWSAVHGLIEGAHKRLVAGAAPELAREVEAFAAREASWLEPYALYEGLCADHGRPYWREWPSAEDRRLFAPREGEEAAFSKRRAALKVRHAGRLTRQALTQYLAQEEHGVLRAEASRLGLALYGDLQVGFAPEDAWAWRARLLPDYLLGAPPSRTNPEGQPWGYPVLDPAQRRAPDGAPGPALALLLDRVRRLVADFDGLRLDHPHGLVCPWVYAKDAVDPHAAVRAGARLHGSPDLPDHPRLGAYALVSPEQLDRTLPRHADGWVRSLRPGQVDAYAELVDAIVETMREAGRAPSQLVCEVLSTCPNPLAEVAARHGLGRFRVTQKASLTDPADVYRGENARPEDWIMLGNHDTPTVWARADEWVRGDGGAAQLDRLVVRLVPEGTGAPQTGGGTASGDATVAERREALKRRLLGKPGGVVLAKTAELFLGPARNVLVFFGDLFGLREPYNVPGTVSPSNWSLRVPPDWEARLPGWVDAGRAMDLREALALSLEASEAGRSARGRAVIQALRAG